MTSIVMTSRWSRSLGKWRHLRNDRHLTQWLSLFRSDDQTVEATFSMSFRSIKQTSEECHLWFNLFNFKMKRNKNCWGTKKRNELQSCMKWQTILMLTSAEIMIQKVECCKMRRKSAWKRRQKRRKNPR